MYSSLFMNEVIVSQRKSESLEKEREDTEKLLGECLQAQHF